jgi:pyrroloquinoline quinone biosynthesis protein B
MAEPGDQAMRVRLLGTAAGGGFPQWNCHCAHCRGVRTGRVPARARSQSGAAISAEGRRWFLLNASPDLRQQIEGFAPLRPADGRTRSTPIEGVLLTNADLDHTVGLFSLREGGRLPVHATPSVRGALTQGVTIGPVLESYGGLEWREPPAELAPLFGADGTPSGLRYAAFSVPGKPPRYREGRVAPAADDGVGYCFVDERTGGQMLFIPDAAALDSDVLRQLPTCDVLLLDGTFWSNNEMERMGTGTASAAEMGHLPVGGVSGSLACIASLPISRRIYIHINNTNPMLIEDSPERAAVEAAGVEVGWDGLEFEL